MGGTRHRNCSFVVALVSAALMALATNARAAGGPFVQTATLSNASGVSGDNAGRAVAISGDGSTTVVGAPYALMDTGVVYVYTRGAGGWASSSAPAILSASAGGIGDVFGTSVAVSQDGSVIVVGAPSSNLSDGGVYIFNRPAGGWAPGTTYHQTTAAIGTSAFEEFGQGVAVSPDSSYVAVGAPGYTASASQQGAVFVYAYDGATLSAPAGSGALVAGDAAAGDGLGWSVAMPSDSLIYSGAPLRATGSGAVYGFSSESSAEVGYNPWVAGHVSQTELTGGGSVHLGWSVATGGGIVAAGGPGNNAGSVYVFEPTFSCISALVHGCFSASSPTTPTAVLNSAEATGSYGVAVAVGAGGRAVLAGEQGTAAGSGFLFLEPAGGWANASTSDATLTPSDSSANDSFGIAVGISADGGAMVVGNPGGASATGGEADVWEPATQTTVSCQPAGVDLGGQTTCTATVTGDGTGLLTPTGNIAFTTDRSGALEGATGCTLGPAGSGASSCQGTFTATIAGLGDNVLKAAFSGDEEHAASTGQTTVAEQVATTTTLSCHPAPVIVRRATACTVTVTAAQGGASAPTGTVSLTKVGSGALSAMSCTLSGSGSSASCGVGYVPTTVGAREVELTAAYGGDGLHGASLAADQLQVLRISTRTRLRCTPKSVSVGATVECIAVVTDRGPSTLIPSGIVRVSSTGAGRFNAGRRCGLVRASRISAHCEFAYRPTRAAKHLPRLRARYGGDQNHQRSAATARLRVS